MSKTVNAVETGNRYFHYQLLSFIIAIVLEHGQFSFAFPRFLLPFNITQTCPQRLQLAFRLLYLLDKESSCRPRLQVQAALHLLQLALSSGDAVCYFHALNVQFLVRHRLEVDLRCIFGLRSRRARSCRCDQKKEKRKLR